MSNYSLYTEFSVKSVFDTIFKAYDVRGIYSSQLNEKIAYRIGEAYATTKMPKKIVVGRDVRDSGESLKKELVSALVKCGVDIVDIGIITTDQLYFTVGKYGYDGGISVTASHNPSEYNGFKFSDAGGAPISSESLAAMCDWAASDKKPVSASAGSRSARAILDDYIEHVLTYVDPINIKPLKIVANANFGAVGRSMDKIAQKLNLNLHRINWNEDGSFPKGPPNPLLPESRDETIAHIKKFRPNLGVAWDADADRVFFFTGDGSFVPSCYIIALLSAEFLRKHPGSAVVHDITTAWVIEEAITQARGRAVTNRTGHTFMKARMRQEDAIFAGESSGHYYFRDSFYADNGIIPFLMVLEIVSKTGKQLKELVEPLMRKYKVSGEINFTVDDPAKSIELIESRLGKEGEVDKTDGLVVASSNWRFSVRPSNTEPLFRLNAEARDQASLNNLVKRISRLINT